MAIAISCRLATPAIVWISGLAEAECWSNLALIGIIGMTIVVGLIHPHELSYFNELAGGPIGGPKILSDSNLDWGQGAKALARLQRARPELRELTFFYFGETDPSHYGVEGRRIVFDANHGRRAFLPGSQVDTPYLAVRHRSSGAPGVRPAISASSMRSNPDLATPTIRRSPSTGRAT